MLGPCIPVSVSTILNPQQSTCHCAHQNQIQCCHCPFKKLVHTNELGGYLQRGLCTMRHENLCVQNVHWVFVKFCPQVVSLDFLKLCTHFEMAQAWR
jgi:hypothetical protein